MKDFSRSQAVTYTGKVIISRKQCFLLVACYNNRLLTEIDTRIWPSVSWRSFPYCNPLQIRYLLFVARRAVPLYLQSFLSVPAIFDYFVNFVVFSAFLCPRPNRWSLFVKLENCPRSRIVVWPTAYWLWPVTFSFNPRWATIVTQRSVGSKIEWKQSDEQTDKNEGDCITSRANAVGNNYLTNLIEKVGFHPSLIALNNRKPNSIVIIITNLRFAVNKQP